MLSIAFATSRESYQIDTRTLNKIIKKYTHSCLISEGLCRGTSLPELAQFSAVLPNILSKIKSNRQTDT